MASAPVDVLPALLHKVAARQDLTAAEAASVMEQVMDGRAPEAPLGALLMGLAMKGAQPDEIVGFARAMRRRAVPLPGTWTDLVDTCGTGGDRTGSVNVSTAAAIVLAGAGARVAKHGNRSVSSRCGSADVLEALGVNVAASPAVAARTLEEAGLAFLFAPTFHPAMKHAAPVRRALGLPTAFNLLGPLTNPAGPRRQIVGVPRPDLTELLARALVQLGAERVWVVHGSDGLDEISTTGHTKVSEGTAAAVRTFYVHPHDFGLPRAAVSDLRGGDARENAAILARTLEGEPGPVRDVVLLNAGAALFVAGRASDVRAGIAQAAEAIDSGRARGALDSLRRVSQGEGGAA